jgi:hypothetical protein
VPLAEATLYHENMKIMLPRSGPGTGGLPTTRAPAASRRKFLRLLAGAMAATLTGLALRPAGAQLLAAAADHPDPRPDIDGATVLTADQLTAPHLAELFDAVREIPHIADGLRCFCGCAHIEGYRSLLTCYEAPGMAQYCEICQGQARLAHGRWKEGQTLDQIRRATDARYGGGNTTSHATGDAHCHDDG